MNKLYLVVQTIVLSNYAIGQCFSSSSIFPIDPDPKSCVVAKLDFATGVDDVAVTSYTNNSISVLLFSGNANLMGAKTYSVGSNPTGIAAGDLDNDSYTDIVVCNEGDDNISVLYFKPTSLSTATFTVGQSPQSVTIADFNLDGKPDIAVANYLSNDVSILINQGGQNFAPPQSLSAGTAPVFIVATYLAGDSIPDLAVVNYFGNNISLLNGNGNGTFGPPQNFSVGTNPVSITSFFANQDNHPDFAVCNEGSSDVTLLISTGSGTFKNSLISCTNAPSWISSGDYNGDSAIDIATTSGTEIFFLFGDNNGGFNDSAEYTLPFAPVTLGTSDFNNDSKTDLFAAGWPDDGILIFNSSTGIFSKPVVSNTSFWRFASGDLNGDSIPDIVKGNPGNPSTGDSIVVCIGNGDGTFQPLATYYISFAGPSYVGIADLNEDGKNDISVVDNNYFYYFEGNGNGTLTYKTSFNVYSVGGFYPTFLKMADFNSDNNLDAYMFGNTGGFGVILFGDGAGGFPSYSNSVPAGLLLEPNFFADFDNDGDTDIVALQPPNLLIINTNNGSGSFVYSTFQLSNTTQGGSAISYFNNDPYLDIVALTDSGLSVYFGNGNMTFQSPLNSPAIGSGEFFVAADYDNDSLSDIIYTRSSSPYATFFQKGNGNGQFAIPKALPPSPLTSVPSLAISDDFDNNGIADYAHSAPDALYIYFACTSVTNNPILSVKETESPYGLLKLFPNPTSDRIVISGKGHLTMYNVLGIQVYSEDLKEDFTTLNLTNMSKGVYIVHVVTSEGILSNKLILH